MGTAPNLHMQSLGGPRRLLFTPEEPRIQIRTSRRRRREMASGTEQIISNFNDT